MKDSKRICWKNKEIRFSKKLVFRLEVKKKGRLFFNVTLRIDKDTPYFVNMSDDPSLAGCLIFYLIVGENKFGSGKNQGFFINGLGIKK